MSFPRYSAYKDTGIDWIGQIPSHWSVIPLAKVATQPGALFIDGDWVESKDLADEGIRYITTGNVGQGQYKEQGAGYVSEETFEQLRCTEVMPGDILVSRLNLPIGRACVVPDLGERIITSVDNVITRPDDKYSRAYLAYMLSSKQHFANMEVLARGTTMQRISRSTLGHVRFALPNLEEQNDMANFLDRETAKIDALVAEQQRLIELLQEKRQAVISHAVTKGLNPDAPMKDSEVEWLGEVPEHWAFGRLGYFCSVENGTTPSRDNLDYWLDGDVPWLSSGEVNQYRIIESTEFITRKALSECSLRILPVGTVVVGMIGQGKTRGMAASLGIEATINQNLAGLIPCEKLLSDYLLFLLQCLYVYLREFGRGGQQAALNSEILKALRIPLPPPDEQRAILSFLSPRLEKFDTLTTEAQRANDLLQERRSALISAAVTGQIDVRGLEKEEEP